MEQVAIAATGTIVGSLVSIIIGGGKMNKKLYKNMCKEASEINTCVFIDGQCKKGSYCCCNGCSHLTDSGCKINSLLCKIWICDVLRAEMEPDSVNNLQKMWDEAGKEGFLVIRGTPKTKSDEFGKIESPDGSLYKLLLGKGSGRGNQ